MINLYVEFLQSKIFRRYLSSEESSHFSNFWSFNTYFCVFIEKWKKIRQKIKKSKDPIKQIELQAELESLKESLSWLWKKNVFQLQNLIFLPLHQHNHWSLIAIKNFKDVFYKYYKSQSPLDIKIGIIFLDSLQTF